MSVKPNEEDIIDVRKLPPEARSKIILPQTTFLNYNEDKIKNGNIAIAKLRHPHDISYNNLIIPTNLPYGGGPIKISVFNQSKKNKIFIPSHPHYIVEYYPISVEIDNPQQMVVLNNILTQLELNEEAHNSVSRLLVDTVAEKGDQLAKPGAQGPIKRSSNCNDNRATSTPTTSSALHRDSTLITIGKKKMSREDKTKIIFDVIEKDKNLTRFEEKLRTDIVSKLKKSIMNHLEVIYFEGDEIPKWKGGKFMYQ